VSKVRYSATFTLPDGSEFAFRLGSIRDYGYTVAWLLVDGNNKIVAKGFSRDKQYARAAVSVGLRCGRTVLYAPVTKGGAA